MMSRMKWLRAVLAAFALLAAVGWSEPAHAGAASTIFQWVFGSKTPAASAEKESGVARLNAFYGNQTGCVFCTFVGRFAQIADEFTVKTFRGLAPVTNRFIRYFFMIYVVVSGLKLVFPFVGGNPQQILGDLIRRSFLFVFVTLTLSSPMQSAFLEWGYRGGYGVAGELSSIVVENIAGAEQPAGCGQFNPAPGQGGGVLHAEDIRGIICQVELIEGVVMTGVIAGLQSMLGFEWSNVFLDIVKLLLHIVSGAAIAIVFGINMIVFPFTFIDLIFRVSLIVAFAPFFLGGLLFGITQGMARAAAVGLAASFMTIVFNVAVFAMTRQIMQSAAEMVDPQRFAGADGLYKFLTALDGRQGVDFTLYNPGWWYFFGAAIFLKYAASNIGSIVGQLLGSSLGSGNMMGAVRTGFAVLGGTASTVIKGAALAPIVTGNAAGMAWGGVRDSFSAARTGLTGGFQSLSEARASGSAGELAHVMHRSYELGKMFGAGTTEFLKRQFRP